MGRCDLTRENECKPMQPWMRQVGQMIHKLLYPLQACLSTGRFIKRLLKIFILTFGLLSKVHRFIKIKKGNGSKVDRKKNDQRIVTLSKDDFIKLRIGIRSSGKDSLRVCIG